MTTQPHLRVEVGFNKLSDHGVEELAGAVLAGMTGNKAFPTPPVDLAAVQAALVDFTTAIAAGARGGPRDKGQKQRICNRVGLKDIRQAAGSSQTGSSALSPSYRRRTIWIFGLPDKGEQEFLSALGLELRKVME